jgi:hypothetical protein
MASDRLHNPRRMFRRGGATEMRGRANRWERMIWNEDDADCLTPNGTPVSYANGLHNGVFDPTGSSHSPQTLPPEYGS